MIKKCKFYNDSQTAAVLMIDDLSLTATTIDGKLQPSMDWGYGLNQKKSLYRYFQDTLLTRYPEVKGTFFVPFQYNALQNPNSGYTILSREFDNKFKEFYYDIKDSFEIAFHGLTHGKYIDDNNPQIRENWRQEFEDLTCDDIVHMQSEIKKFEEYIETKIYGGKYPGYANNEHSEGIIEQLGFKWWASDSYMIGKKCSHNRHKYFGERYKVLDFPTNVSGSVFNNYLYTTPSWKNIFRDVKTKLNYFKQEQYLQYLYENQYIISIQEHFQNLRTDGKRQQPNVYDDINSLDKFFALLRGADIWYAACTEIAHYIDSYDFTDINLYSDNCWLIEYKGHWETMLLSVKTNNRYIKNKNTGQISEGIYKQGIWIFNNIKEGLYECI
jgi:hypothetical protein